MLRIYDVCIELVREVAVLVEQVAKHDRDQARQLRRSMVSVVFNVAGGGAGAIDDCVIKPLSVQPESRWPISSVRWRLDVGELSESVRGRFERVIGTLVKVVR